MPNLSPHPSPHLAPRLTPHLTLLARYRKPVEDLGLASLAMRVVAANFPAIEEED